jgi:ADP-heptose:LPS heptosyltransferase/glycosyltransferase involved in cell wall biosynthesis
MVKLSVVVITFNEEAKIERCLHSVVDVADEIVILDSLSTDKTREICSRFEKVKFYEQPFLGYIEQKNKALEFAENQFVLSLDADEALSDELKLSILKIKSNGDSDGYTFNRLNNYCGQWIRHTDWYPDRKLRLFDKNKGHWAGENPHDQYVMDENCRIGHLKGDLLHYSYDSISQHIIQQNRFSDIAARVLFDKGKKTSIAEIIFRPLWKFIRNYFIRLGFMDGFYGFVVSSIISFYTFCKYLKLFYLMRERKKEDRRLSADIILRSSILTSRYWKFIQSELLAIKETIIIHDIEKKAGNLNKNKVDNIKKILISRTDSIGDVMLTLPVIGFLKKEIPAVKIYFLGKEYTEEVVNAYPDVDYFLNWSDISQRPEKEQVEFFKELNIDLIIHVFPRKEIAKISYLSKIPLNIGTSNRWYHWAYCNKKVWMTRKRSNLHESQLNFKLLQPIGLDEVPSLDFICQFYQLKVKKDLPVDIYNSLAPDKFNIILHPKSNGSGREWGVDRFIQLARALPSSEYKIFITGTEKEGALIREKFNSDDLKDKIVDLTGKLTLSQLISFISKSDCLLAAGTGPLHIAAALNIYAIGLFPPVRPVHPERWSPISPKSFYFTKKGNCNSSCKNETCSCMSLISVADVLKLINALNKAKKENILLMENQ